MNQSFHAYEQPVSVAVATLPSLEPRYDEDCTLDGVSPALVFWTLGAASLTLLLTIYLLLWLI